MSERSAAPAQPRKARKASSPPALAWLTATAFLLPLVLYGLTAARTIQGGDAGELGVIALLGGVAHPPGYPLYTLIARAFAHLPFGAPFWRASMTSAVFGAATVALLFRLLFRLTAALPAAFLAALAFGVSSLQWRLSGVPEVFTLNALAAVAVLWLALDLAEADVPGVARSSLVLGLVLGLAMANHHSAVLLAPMPLWAFVELGRRLSWERAGRALALLAAGALVGLLPYLLLLSWPRTASPYGSVWGNTETLSGLLHHVLRRDYGTITLASGSAAGTYDPMRHIGLFLRELPGEYVYVFFAAGLAGIVLALRRRTGFAGALLATFVLSSFVFLALFNLRDSPTKREVAERFHLLPNLLFAPFVAFGLAAAWKRMTPALAGTLAGVTLVLGASASFLRADWARDTSIERMARAEVEATVPGAVIVGRGDTEGQAITWVTHVLDDRPDVHYVDLHLASYRWYAARKQRELGAIPLPPPVTDARAGLFAEELARSAPTYLLPTLSIDAARDATLEPAGFLDRVVPPGTPPLSLDSQAQRLRQASGVYPGDARQPPSPAIDAWAEEIHIAAGYRWLTLAEALRKAGRVEQAKDADDEAQALLPADWGG